MKMNKLFEMELKTSKPGRFDLLEDMGQIIRDERSKPRPFPGRTSGVPSEIFATIDTLSSVVRKGKTVGETRRANVEAGCKTSLRDATKSAPNSMGCYKIYYHGLKYVGKAEDGIRKRFVQYYNGTTAHYPSAQKIYQHRDEITVTWQVCSSREETRALEAEWIEQYAPEWNERSGWGK